VDLTFSAEEQAFRDQARTWLEANVPAAPLRSMDTPEGFAEHRQWERTLGEGGWSAVWWPAEYGGRGADLMHWLIFEEEYHRAGAPLRVNQNGVFLLGPTLLDAGTDAQKSRFLTSMAAGEEVWCQGWSEPNAGSDLAGIQSRARLSDDGSHWVVSGQKTWCSRAVWADWLFGLFRSDPEAERHRGLTYLLMPLDSPGITVRPIAKLDGEAGFAEVFFDDVRVDAANTLGEVGRGWQIAMATAGFERGILLRSPGRYMESTRRLLDLYRATDGGDAALRDAVVAAWMDAEAYRLHTYHTVSRVLDGEVPGAEVSLNKIFWSEMDVRIQEAALRLFGDRALLAHGAPDAPDGGRWLHGWMASLAGTIFAGTNQIQRNIVADRVLRLPRGS
jgi:alkylation response protein AidB-like acyl-CoA dehydrogenase